MIYLKSECLQCKDVDGLSRFILCVCVCWGGKKMYNVIVFAHMPSPVSVCTFTSKCMNMHICVHDVLPQ